MPSGELIAQPGGNLGGGRRGEKKRGGIKERGKEEGRN
jgi:hypothetical protein